MSQATPVSSLATLPVHLVIDATVTDWLTAQLHAAAAS